MAERLTQRRRVGEDGPWVVTPVSGEEALTVPTEEAPANYVPAAAVRRRGRALFGITGRKELVGGRLSLAIKPTAQLWIIVRYWLS